MRRRVGIEKSHQSGAMVGIRVSVWVGYRRLGIVEERMVKVKRRRRRRVREVRIRVWDWKRRRWVLIIDVGI